MKFFGILLTLVILTLSANTQQLSLPEEQFVDSLMNASYKPDKPGAVLLIARNGQSVFRKAYGLANLEFNISTKPEYIFQIGSMSKQFIAVSILQLAQAGKLNLQDDISKYLSGYNTHGRHITIENLLTHSSGIIDFFDKKEFASKVMNDQTREETMNFFMDDSLLFEPGTGWSYSNSGYTLAGFIIEKVSGLSLSDYMQQNIFNPLEMTHTCLGRQDSVISNGVNDYEPTGNGKLKPAGHGSWSWIYVAGGIRTNVDDLLKWDNALYTEKIANKEWLEKAWKPGILHNGRSTYYGFGWTVNSFHGLQIITHAGLVNAFICDGIRVPSRHLYIIILSNSYPPWPPDISKSVLLHISNLDLSAPSPSHPDKKTLNSYAGVYAVQRQDKILNSDSATGRTYQYFIVNNDSLFAETTPGGDKEALFPVSKDLFASVYAGQYYQFVRDEKEKVISLEHFSEPIQYGPRELKVRTNLPLPKEKQAVLLDIKKLELLTGKYDFDGGNTGIVTVEGNKLFIQMPGQGKEEIFAENDTYFFSKSNGTTYKFGKNGDKVSGLIVNNEGRAWEAKKTD